MSNSLTVREAWYALQHLLGYIWEQVLDMSIWRAAGLVFLGWVALLFVICILAAISDRWSRRRQL